MKNLVKIHPTAEVSDKSIIGDGTSIWNWAQIREDCILGAGCIVGKGVYVDVGVRIGSRVKIQNHASIFKGVEIQDGCFVGPHVCFTNDLFPRATLPNGSSRGDGDWTVTKTRVNEGASIGANSTIVCGIEIGSWAMIGAGSVVVSDVPPHGLMVGNPARLIGYVCKCGMRLKEIFIEDRCCEICKVKN